MRLVCMTESIFAVDIKVRNLFLGRAGVWCLTSGALNRTARSVRKEIHSERNAVSKTAGRTSRLKRRDIRSPRLVKIHNSRVPAHIHATSFSWPFFHSCFHYTFFSRTNKCLVNLNSVCFANLHWFNLSI